LSMAFKEGKVPHLKELDMKGMRVEAAGARMILEGLVEGCPMIESLNLAGAGLGPEGMIVLAELAGGGHLASIATLDLA